MRFTLSWLYTHLKADADLSTIVETLTKIGLEVEEIIENNKIYGSFVIAEIIEALPHPNADKLRLCRVSDGTRILNIVCGAPNARAGIKVVLAPVGAIIPAGGFAIKAANIRGQASEGMLCSAAELNLPADNQDGIIELPVEAPVGGSFAKFAGLDDVIIEIALTPNRGDAASVHGIARDLYAAGMGEFSSYQAHEIDFKEVWPVIIEDLHGCPEFTLTYMRGVDNTQPTGSFIEQCLQKSGAGLRSALVNISNFAMFDYGRPNHIYDADKVSGPIVVRGSREAEQFVALGGVEYILPAGLLVIADSEKILAIAGVMGGELSKVTEETKNILIEVANFHPEAVMKSGRALDLLSQSRYRFERRIDTSNTAFFIAYITQLIEQLAGGHVEGSVRATGEQPAYCIGLHANYDKIKKLSGCDISDATIESILTKLGFTIQGNTIGIPPHRYGDISRWQDLAEEVLRIYGLDNVPPQCIPLELREIKLRVPPPTRTARAYLISLGYEETISYAFIGQQEAQKFATTPVVEVLNPISADMAAMRPSTLPGLLKKGHDNMAYGLIDGLYFETGNIYHGIEGAQQKYVLSGVRIGKVNRKTHFKEERPVDFFDAKADMLSLIELYGIPCSKLKFSREVPSYYHPGKAAAVMLGNIVLGYAGELHPMILKDYDLPTAVAFEIFVSDIPASKNLGAKKTPQISYLQLVVRDFAFEVGEKVAVGEMMNAIMALDRTLIESVQVFDIYQGTGIIEGRKSVGFSVGLRPIERTLTDTEIDAMCIKITALIKEEYGGIQR